MFRVFEARLLYTHKVGGLPVMMAGIVTTG